MTNEKFEALVRKLEAFSQAHPRAYRLRVALLAGLWNAIGLASLLVLVLLVAWIVIAAARGDRPSAVLARSLGLLFYLMFFASGLWIRIPLPVGLGLDRRKYPKLFQAIDSVCRRLDAPPVHRILVDDELNAAVMQFPRLGIFGLYRNYLIVGLPLMQALTPEQFTAVVAHEMGHLSRRHGAFGHWIYRAHCTSARWIGVALSWRSGPVLALLRRFLAWYVPYFAAYSFVLRRSNEYEADRCSAEIVGQQQTAEALVTVDIAGRFMGEYVWPEIYRLAKDASEPPQGVFPLVARIMPQATRVKDAPRWARQAIMSEPDPTDSHPRLSERLAALGQLAHTEGKLSMWHWQPAPAGTPSAAQQFFGDALPELIALLEKGWRVRVTRQWRKHHQKVQAARKLLIGFENKARNAPLTDSEAWRRCLLVAELRSKQDAIPLLRDFQRIHSKVAEVNFTLARMLLEENDESGITLMEQAMAGDLRCVFEGCEAIAAFLARQGRTREADAYLRRAEVHFHAVRQGSRERRHLDGEDQFRAADISGEWVDYLVVRLEEIKEVAEAWLVEKVVKNFSHHKHYILAIIPRDLSIRTRRRIQSQLSSKVRNFDEPLSIVILGRGKEELAKAIRSVREGKVHPRKPLRLIRTSAGSAIG